MQIDFDLKTNNNWRFLIAQAHILVPYSDN